MDYCPPNVSLSQIWVDHGLSPCLTDTIVSSVGLGFVVLFGTIELLFYRKYATIVQHYALPYSQLFGLQIVLNGLMPLIAIIRISLELLVFQPGIVHGFMILDVVSSIIVWPFICVLILRERNYMLPTVPTKGHGLPCLIFWTGNLVAQNLILLNIRNPHWFFQFSTPKDIIQFSLFTAQYLASTMIFFLGLKAPGIPSIRHSESFSRLHPDGDENDNGPAGSRINQGSPFRNFWSKVKMLMPFVWPKKSCRLQFYVFVCFLSLILGRITNVYVPLYSKYIVDSMTIVQHNNGTDTQSFSAYAIPFVVGATSMIFRWDLILIYVALKCIQGGGAGTSGLLSNIRSFLWISVQQYTTREVQVKFFGHLHHLSLRWHLQRKTGEVLRAMDRGTESVNSILNYLVFSIIPTVADIIIAVVYFTAFFNYWFGLIVFITMLVYLIATFVVTEWRTKFRRMMNLADNEQRQQAVDSLLNFETVKYYANENYEIDRYQTSIIKFQLEEWKTTASVCLLNLIQLFVINGGLLIGSLLCVKMVVTDHSLTVGDYVLFSSYLMQLYTPLNYFGTYYRVLQKCFIDMENMMDLFKEEAEVKDIPGAPDLQIKHAHIEFRNVNFNYVPEKQVLNNISFSIPSGQTLALVGPSGSGKSTIVRLLFRFYDPSSGDIYIDGQNIKDVTQLSLRKFIGVVPQDTVLFNDTIHHNIKYGNIGSDDYDMIEAAKAAQIHEKVCSFPQRYDTVVGERGLKLSGGEKQRVAIARTILKNPCIILLDEATSALDTRTERQIQSSLQALCENRTSVIVAHRLSTIVHADNILVVGTNGDIAEHGTHDQLMKTQGLYASMWNEQLKTDFNDAVKKEENSVE